MSINHGLNPISHLKVVGPISTLVTSIRVQGQLLGAHVCIISLTDNQVKASGVATRKDQRFELLPNTLLNKNDRLVATQTLGTETSELPPHYLAVPVQQAPQAISEIGTLKIEEQYYEGIDHLWISGCIPGARVEAYFDGEVQSQDIAEEGVVRLKLSNTLPKGMPIIVYQIVEDVGKGPSSTVTLEFLEPPRFRHRYGKPSYP